MARARPPWWIAGGIAAGAAAILVGIEARYLTPVLIGLMTLLPVISHVRWVGFRRAVAEPSAVTFIVLFYLLVFPQRALVLALSNFEYVDIVRGGAANVDLVGTLAIASLGTTAFVEAFHWFRSRRDPRADDAGRPAREMHSGLLVLASLLAGLALATLLIIVVRNHGLAQTSSQFQSHSKAVGLEEKSLTGSLWSTLAVPAVWCAACVAVRKSEMSFVRVVFIAASLALVLAQLLIFGSRLNALLALMGVWVVYHYSGRTVPAAAVLASIPILVVISIPIIGERPGGDLSRLPAYERYSRTAGYGVLEAALSVRQQPSDIKRELLDSRRWLDLPGYLVPSVLWRNKPDLESRRLDVFVAQALDRQGLLDTGLPTSYVTELRLYGGWPAVLFLSALIGGALGALHRRLVGRRRPSPSSLLWYCFFLTCAFSYYKDGDILMNLVGDSRAGVYLAVGMLATGVWAPLGGRKLARRASFKAAPATDA